MFSVFLSIPNKKAVWVLYEEAKRSEIENFLRVAKEAVWSLDFPYKLSFGLFLALATTLG